MITSSSSPATNLISTGAQTRARLALLMGRITAVILGIVTVALIYYSISHPSWQGLLLTGIQTASWLIACSSLLRAIKNPPVRGYLLITAILIMMTGFSIFISGQVITSVLIVLAYTLVITSVSISGSAAERGLLVGIAGAWTISLTSLVNPLEKISLPGIHIAMPVFLGILIILYFAILALHYSSTTLRMKIIIGGLLFVMIPLMAVSLLQTSIVQNTVLDHLSTTLITVILAGLAALFITLFSRALTQPIVKLTETAHKISQGDLTVDAQTSNDEIGSLANTFNFLTGRLREFITELERQKNLQTSELAEKDAALTIRDRQIHTVSEVARTIASSQDVEPLLDQVTDFVSTRFNFYHTGIFLIDENQEFAVLQASNSEGGKRMLARGHMLRIGQTGIVGHVCESGEARIATDVGNDAVFFNNPDLPHTRSEMALPLVGGGQIIGALDVQSIQPNAFSKEDIELFSTLADQIAIAVLNNRALEETQRALVEAQLVHRQYLQQEWNRELGEKEHHAYEFTPQGLVIHDRVESQEIDLVFSTGEMVLRNSAPDHSSQEPAVLGMPIKLRGETIGIIQLQDESNISREWANEDIQIVQTIADQVAQALENARLFQQTVRRADRERKVIEISSKIRSTNDPELMLQIAVEELQHALHASKTQVILNQIFDKPDSEKGPSNGPGFTGPTNGNGKSKLA